MAPVAAPFPWLSAPNPVLPRTHGVVWMEDVGGGRVVEDKHPPQVSAQAAQVLHVISPVEDAGLTEQPRPEGPPLVQKVSYWVCVLRREHGSSAAEGDPEVQPAAGWGRMGGQCPRSPWGRGGGLTLARLAVNSTHSNSSPIRCRNSSTWGRFST